MSTKVPYKGTAAQMGRKANLGEVKANLGKVLLCQAAGWTHSCQEQAGCPDHKGQGPRVAGGAAVFLDEKGVNQCTSLGHGSTYTWFIFQQQQHLSKGWHQEAPGVPSTQLTCLWGRPESHSLECRQSVSVPVMLIAAALPQRMGL